MDKQEKTFFRPLIITEAETERIKQMRQYAMDNIYTFDDILDMHNGQKDPPGYVKERVMFIPHGYRIVYSIEQQPGGLYRHISIGVETPGRLPHIAAVNMIIGEFGFSDNIESGKYVIKLEDISREQNESHMAVNIVGKIEDGERP